MNCHPLFFSRMLLRGTDLTIGPRRCAPTAAVRLFFPTLAFAAGLALCLAPVGPARGAGAESDAPAAAREAAGLKEARALMRTGKFGAALAVLRPLLRHGRVSADVLFNWAPFVLGGGARRDRTWSVRLNVLNRALTFRGISPQVSAVYERRTSNAQLHDYRRFSGELRFVRLF